LKGVAIVAAIGAYVNTKLFILNNLKILDL